MEGSIIDIVVFAPLAPIAGVILFWFIKMLFIEGQKLLLEKIRPKHGAFCRFTNFLGIFFQTVCHALGYTITKSGISNFYISVNYGKVAPKKEKKGIFEWVANAFLFIGPFFIPPIALILCLLFLLENGFDTSVPLYISEYRYTFGGQLTVFGTNLYRFSASFFNFLFTKLDLFHPAHLGFFILMILVGLGIRPSYLGEKKINKVDLLYDLKNIWRLITQKPIYLLLLLLTSYVFFYASLLLNKGYYATVLSIFGWLSIVSIVSIFTSCMVITFIYFTDKIEGRKKIIPYITILISYIIARTFFIYIKTDLALGLSLIIMLLSTIFVTYLLLKPKGDKLKTKKKIKWLETR